MPAVPGEKNSNAIKFEKALHTTMRSLLAKNSFKKITVKDICAESLISRTSFYLHFSDKYAFLKWWMIHAWTENAIDRNDPYCVREQRVNQLVDQNKALLRNLLLDADSWTLDVLFDVLQGFICEPVDSRESASADPKYIVWTNFYVGGIIQYILWQVRNNFPETVKPMNIHLEKVMKTFRRYQ